MKFERAKVTVRGAVQGVGFRPHVYRIATELGLNGWVLNSSQGVFIEVEGASHALRQFQNNVALSVGTEAFISQHIGDLETSQAWSAFRKVAADLPRLYGTTPDVIACDLAPVAIYRKTSSRSSGRCSQKDSTRRSHRAPDGCSMLLRHFSACASG